MKRSAFLLILFILLFSQSFATGFLRVTGKYISDDNGEFLLRGLGLGGWLVPEGYMLQIPGYGSPTDIRTKIVGLIGEANTDTFFAIYRRNFVTREDIALIASWGFNSIRLPMHYALLTPKNEPGVYSEEGFVLIDSVLSWCEAYHLYLILDLHCAPGGQNSANISDYISGEPSLWESADNRTRTVELWKKLAERYHDKEWIGGYDLLNETVWNFGGGNAPLRELYVKITNAIREVDTTHIVFIEGNNWANDFTGLDDPWDAKMVYSFHKYWNSNDAGSIASFITLRNTANRPLWLGESGENSNQWFADCIALIESNKIGWSWWTYKKIGTVNGMLSVVKNNDYNSLLRYWNGQISKPSADFAFAALLAQADRFKLSQCQARPDVIDAIFRQPHSNARKKFADNPVPGKVLSINYDMGPNGVSYGDADMQAVGQGQDWNQGWQYRNDGVDIESCSDLYSGGYDIGWIEDNEFLKITFTATKSAGYSVTARVAAPAVGGKILMQIDDTVLVGMASVPSTGGYQSWQTIPVGTCRLDAGEHSMRLYFTHGGFNLTYIEMLDAPTSVESDPGVPETYTLFQNYPNPFNPVATIRYQIPEASHVSLTVHDMLGRLVAVLCDEQQPAGDHSRDLDASQFPSGIYFYTLRAASFVQTKRMSLIK